MLVLNQCVLRQSGGGSPLGLSYVSEAFITANSNPATFTSQNIGVEDSSRIVVVVVTGRANNGATHSVSAVTIGGNSATLAVRNPTIGIQSTEIWYRAVPSGTTATIAVTSTQGEWKANCCGIHVYRLVGATATPSATGAEGYSSEDPRELAVTVPSGAVTLAAGGGDFHTRTWTKSSNLGTLVQTNSGDEGNLATGISTSDGSQTFRIDPSGGDSNLLVACWGS
jgi:hypothetical protein